MFVFILFLTSKLKKKSFSLYESDDSNVGINFISRKTLGTYMRNHVKVANILSKSVFVE